jgi:hypothetical protein
MNGRATNSTKVSLGKKGLERSRPEVVILFSRKEQQRPPEALRAPKRNPTVTQTSAGLMYSVPGPSQR